MSEEVINRHWFGAFMIYLSGVVPMSALLYFTYVVPLPAQLPSYGLALLAFFAITVVTLVAVYVYNGTYMRLNDSGINIVKAISLFGSESPETDWNTVVGTDIKTSILYKLFGLGTLIIETADGNENLTMSYVPRVDEVREFIDSHAKAEGGGA